MSDEASFQRELDAERLAELRSLRFIEQQPRAAPAPAAVDRRRSGPHAAGSPDANRMFQVVNRLLHDAEVLAINGPSFRLKGRLDALRARPDEHAEPASTSPAD